MIAKFLARQLSSPSKGIAGWILGPLWNRRNAALNDRTLAALALQPGDRVLEVGFGGGYLLQRMAPQASQGICAGVDISPAMVQAGEKRFQSLIQAGRLDLRCASAESLPYPDASFDKACSVNSIFYWQNAAQALAELHRVLRCGGLLVLTFTSRSGLEGKSFSQHGLSLYDAEDVCPMLYAAGFQTVTTDSGADKHRTFWCIHAVR